MTNEIPFEEVDVFMDDRTFTLKLLESEKMLYRISCSFLRSEADRQDAMQEAALKAWQHRNRMRDEKAFKTWITKIMVNECRNLYRKNAKITLLEKVPDVPAPENREIETRWMLESLPEKQRIPMILYYLEGFSVLEIAQVQHTSIGMIKQRMSQARKKLRIEWNERRDQP